MFPALKPLGTHRWPKVAIAVLLLGAMTLAARLYALSLRDVAFIEGWVLLALLLLLILFNARKKLPGLPLDHVSLWLRVHLYLGLMSVFMFLLHINWRIPNGLLEIVLTMLFTLMVMSGLVGFFLTLSLPPRLARRGEPEMFERIPALRAEIKNRIEALVERSLYEDLSTTVPDFFRCRLLDYLSGPRHFWQHLIESRAPLQALQKEIEELSGYLNDKERVTMAEIVPLLAAKDDLDYQYACQAMLKRWLFMHIPLGYSLLLFSALHLASVYAYVPGS